MVEIGVGQQDSSDRRLARSFARMQFGSRFNLRPEIGRCPQKKPRAATLRYRNLRMRARLAAKDARPHRPAIGAGAIPLRKPTSCRGAKNFYVHLVESNQGSYCVANSQQQLSRTKQG